MGIKEEKKVNKSIEEKINEVKQEIMKTVEEIYNESTKETYKLMRNNPLAFKVSYRILKNLMELNDPEIQTWLLIVKAFTSINIFEKGEEKREKSISELIKKVSTSGIL